MMKTLSIVLLLLACTVAAHAQTNVGGTYFSNQHWTLAGSPYHVTSDVQIAPNFTLTIDPGVHVDFAGGNEILIKGAIRANGSPGTEIVIDGTSADKIIHFLDANLSLSEMRHCQIQDGTHAFYTEGNCSGVSDISHVALSNCLLRMNAPSGTLAIDSSTLVTVEVMAYHNGNTTGELRISDSQIDACSFTGSTLYSIPTYPLVVERSTILNSYIEARHGGGSPVVLLLDADTISQTTLGSWYGTGLITNSYIEDSEFDNSLTDPGTNASYQVENSMIVNTDFVGDMGGMNMWGLHMTLLNCLVEKSAANTFDLNSCEMTNTSILGTGSGTGIKVGYFNAQNSLIAQHDVALHLTNFYSTNLAINGCNFRDNSQYNVVCDSTHGANAANCWWGSADSLTIFTKIRDYYDNLLDGEVVVSPWATAPNTGAPMSPPSGIGDVPGSGFHALSWSANPEADLQGYRLYIGVGSGYRYAQMIDIGNVTTYQLPDSLYDQGVAVTAYDRPVAGPNEIVLGHESGFARISSPLTAMQPAVVPKLEMHTGPNPTSGMLEIAFAEDLRRVEINLHDMQGQLLMRQSAEGPHARMDLSPLPAGMYLLRAQTPSGSTATQRVAVGH